MLMADGTLGGTATGCRKHQQDQTADADQTAPLLLGSPHMCQCLLSWLAFLGAYLNNTTLQDWRAQGALST